MHKTMIAKYRGVCAISGVPINPGDDIVYDTATRRVWLSEPGDFDVEIGEYLPSRSVNKPGYISDVYHIGGREYYRNKRGLCIDSPCCGCCTV
jgi:hypothetical protein